MKAAAPTATRVTSKLVAPVVSAAKSLFNAGIRGDAVGGEVVCSTSGGGTTGGVGGGGGGDDGGNIGGGEGGGGATASGTVTPALTCTPDVETTLTPRLAERLDAGCALSVVAACWTAVALPPVASGMVRTAATLMLPAAETRTSRKHPSFSRQLSSTLSVALRFAFCVSSNEVTSPAMVSPSSTTVAWTGTTTVPEGSGAKGG